MIGFELIIFRNVSGLDYGIFKGIERKGYRQPTPIQRKTIPLIIDGKGCIFFSFFCFYGHLMIQLVIPTKIIFNNSYFFVNIYAGIAHLWLIKQFLGFQYPQDFKKMNF